MYDDALGAISKTFKGNHPVIKKAAKKTIKTAVRHFRKSLGSSLVEDTAMSLLNEGTNRVAGLYWGYFR